jgi:DNA-binding PadR family transcriptional regulator
MEREGMIASEWRQLDDERKRKYYKLLKLGRRALREEQQWMAVHNTLAGHGKLIVSLMIWGVARTRVLRARA